MYKLTCLFTTNLHTRWSSTQRDKYHMSYWYN